MLNDVIGMLSSFGILPAIQFLVLSAVTIAVFNMFVRRG